MKSGMKTPITRFMLYTHKPKSVTVASLFKKGCIRQGYECTIVPAGTTPKANTIGVFYGVVPSTYAAFMFYKAEKSALYIDNGWLSTKEEITFRFAWNSVQPHYQDLPLSNHNEFPELPPIARAPIPNRALLILQSRQYFENLRLPYTRDQWQRAITKVLKMKGYIVETREKPPSKKYHGPDFFQQMTTAGIVVSLNSAACLKAMRYGIPAYCTLDCTLSPYAPVKLPDVGRAAPPNPKDLELFLRRLASYEITKYEITSGIALDRIMGVSTEKRRGYFYGS